jgi:hypothetical protein
LTEQDGSFRRLVETVKAREKKVVTGKAGRPPKYRVPTTGYFSRSIHDRIRALSKARSRQAGHFVSASDLYNEAAERLITDLYELLGDELRLPSGAMSLSGVLGLRELVDRPIRIPLRELELHSEEAQRSTLYVDKPVWEALVEMSLRFGLHMRRPILVQHLLELAAAWYLTDLDDSELLGER